MNTEPTASEEAKTTLENNVAWYLADKLADPSVTIATKKYLTSDNLLVYLTQCNISAPAVPKVKVQVLKRVADGIQEAGYLLFGDRRFEKYENNMIFGSSATEGNTDNASEEVTQAEAEKLLALVGELQNARQTI